MWNNLQTNEYEGMLAETITISGYGGDEIRAYFSRPLGKGPYPGVVFIPHMPGWDELCREATRRFTQHGYAAICPDIYCRVGSGKPWDVAVKARESGGVSDACVMGDCAGALSFLKSQPWSNGKAGVIGMCSGGRHAFLAGCALEGVDAVVDCWGGRVVAAKEELSEKQPVAPIDYAERLSCPVLGIFGNDDMNPKPEHVNILEAELKKLSKKYEFHRYNGAGHAFWSYDRDAYRPVQAMDSWEKVFGFFEANLR